MMQQPGRWPMGEIELGDGRVMLVPHPIKFQDVPLVGPLEDFYLTATDLQPVVVEAPSSNVAPQTDPLWAVVCVLVGAALSVGAGAFLILRGCLS